jgi:Tfp pilus assembly protein FimT
MSAVTSLSHTHSSQGFGLVELLVCLGLMAALITLATPYWTQWQARVQLEATREQLISDLQSARLLALQHGQTVQLSRLNTCSWATTSSNDWSCGWQISLKNSGQVLRTSAQTRPLQISISPTSPFEVDVLGDLGQISSHWIIKALPASLNLANVLCLNSASRLRWQTGESCS